MRKSRDSHSKRTYGSAAQVSDESIESEPAFHIRVSFYSAADDFNNGVVLTRRPLRPNELFQVRLERVVTKWAGSVEMGVTTHTADELDFPFTMTNVR